MSDAQQGSGPTIEDYLLEDRHFPPPPAFAELKHPSIPLKPLSSSYIPIVGRYFALQDRR